MLETILTPSQVRSWINTSRDVLHTVGEVKPTHIFPVLSTGFVSPISDSASRPFGKQGSVGMGSSGTKPLNLGSAKVCSPTIFQTYVYCFNTSYLVDKYIGPAGSRPHQMSVKNVLSWALAGTSDEMPPD